MQAHAGNLAARRCAGQATADAATIDVMAGTPRDEQNVQHAQNVQDAGWMTLALDEARACRETGDVPVGAIVVAMDGAVLGRGRNRREEWQDPTAHAEVLALRSAAAALGSWRLLGCTLVVTLEPCAMCAGALVLARVPALVLGAWDPKAGATGSTRDIVRDARLNHRVEVRGGVLETEAATLLRTFFAARRSAG